MPNNNPQQQTTPQQQIARAAEGASKVAERLGDNAEHATSMAIDKVRQVRDEAQSGIEQQRDQVAERIRRLSGVLRASSQTLSTDDPLAQQLFETVGDRVEQVADYINNITPADLADDITSLARRRPGLFFGGSFILGLALGRFVKSSASVATGGSYDQDDSDDYESTRAARPAKRGGSRKQRREPSAQATSNPTSSSTTPRTPSTSGAQSAQPSSSSASSSMPTPSSASSGSANSGRASSGSASSGSASGGSTSTSTVGSGSTHGASSTPSYGASSSVTTASKPQTSTSQNAAGSTPRDVERGEGSKS